MNKILLSTILAASLLLIAGWALWREKQPPVSAPAAATDLVFYYGDGCPHCANVETYFADNQVADKIKFERKEVYNNQINQDELIRRATACGLDKANIGIPLLWHDGQCVSGDTDIIDFFQEQLNNL